ncbi:helix-turn-helix transcriptional regulator [Maritimibacter harenae]|uniref:helix-turn-helix transcriptional regulator n=1 Tax=Maritimibacter harenae TaxID=2606218 RepID=UPI001F3789CE|nr:helix-turn-helix domain-containing protein [Maritimibacter harenae]
MTSENMGKKAAVCLPWRGSGTVKILLCEPTRSTTMRLLNFNELQTVLGGRGRTTIYRDVAAGRIPAPIKIGGRLYWREDEVETFVEEMASAQG